MRGRDDELAVVESHLDDLATGTGTVLMVEGQAGMGKSRFLDEVEAIALRRSMRVGRGSGDPGDTIVQLAPMLEALCDGPTPILQRDALRDALMSPEQRYWMLEDIEALLEEAALGGPIVLCIDDLQWADVATTAALRTLPRRLRSVPVGWVLAARTGPASAGVTTALSTLEREGGERLTLGPLDARAVALVTADVLCGDADDALLEVAARAGGSPFLLTELLEGLRDENLVRVDAGMAKLVSERLPDRLAVSMRDRLARTSDAARRVAVVAGSLGRRFSLDQVAAMLDEPAAALLDALDELIHSSVLIERDGDLEFRHDLTRDAVRNSVPVPARRGLDRQAAAVLLAAGALPVDVAGQLAASAEPGDEFAISTLQTAAESCAATDPGAAADLGRRALDLAPANHPSRGPLVAGIAVWLHAAARPQEAKTFADTELRDVLSPAHEAEVRLGIARMFSLSPDDRADTCRAALALPGVPTELRARHFATLFHNVVVAGRSEEAAAIKREVADAVDAAGDPGARFIFELAEAGLSYLQGEFAAALELVEAAQRAGLATGDDTRVDLARLTRCDILTALDRRVESLHLSIDSVMAAERNRQGWALRTAETTLGRLLVQFGRLAEALALLHDRYSPDVPGDIVNAFDAAGLGALGRVAIHIGDEALIRHTATLAKAMVDDSAPVVWHHGAWLLALQALAANDAPLAHEWLCRRGQKERLFILPLLPLHIGDEARLVALAVEVGDRELAEATCAEADRRAERNSTIGSIVAVAAHASGVLHRDRDSIAEAARLFERVGLPMAQAVALEHLGEHATEGRDNDEAIDALGRALVVYSEAGATWDAARIRARLRALGVRRRLVTSARPQTGWGALTDPEMTVARLVAQGLTNREVATRMFLSIHTVSGHLRHVFNKLGVTSRVALARVVAQADSQE